ncbi:hypothetical protein CCZ01_04950 [Helicobacter monodelphidis]|uniref:WD40 repeat domain-containing protein n=1 Tax=Helicobacter sp. 15-1451 TaxID=2004995 RepID=UPI000DCC8E2E|nr:hypothetical protein [Helicobacter sp. 15-1451]RAX57798.1 hypothetical protein CCZ01_04950 [Helicobacter sp. 15-1451]
MLPLLHRTKLNSGVVSCTITDKKIFMLDNLYHFYELDASDLSFSKSTQIFKDKEARHKFTHAISGSVDGYLFVTLHNSSQGVILKDGETVAKIANLQWHKATVSSSRFSRDGRYLATGGEDGKTLLFQIPSFKLAGSMLPRPDYIASINFDSKAERIASSSFDGVTVILDIERNLIVGTFELEKTVLEDGVFFDCGNKFFFVCRDGRAGIYNLLTQELTLKEITKEWFTRLRLTTDRRFAIVGTKANKLFIIRLEDLEPIQTLITEHNGISAIDLTIDRLAVAYIDGYIEFYNLQKSLDIFEGLINEGNFLDALRLTKEENVFLSLLPIYTKTMEEQWKKTLKEAIDFLATNRFQEAINLVAPFMDDKRKKEEFSQYAQQIEAVAKFCDAWESKDVQTAYKIAEQSPEVRKLPFFDLLEEYFLQIFNAAKKFLIMDAKNNMPKAQALLKPFLNVKSKKDIAYALLKESNKFQQLDTLLRERKFAELFALAEKHSFLKQTNSYDKAMYIIPQVIDRMNQLMANKNFEKASELSTFLASLAPFKEIGEENLRLIELQKTFLSAVEAKDLKKAYALASEESKLQALPEYSGLNNEFKEIAEQAYNLATDGFTSNVIDHLNPYFEVEYWQEKIASIIKISYLYELDKAAENKATYSDVNWKKSILIYLDRFGLDEEISRICEMRGLMEFMTDIGQGNPKGYKSLPYTYTILIKDVGDANISSSSTDEVDIDALLQEAEI